MAVDAQLHLPEFRTKLPVRNAHPERTLLGLPREIYMFAVLAAAYLNVHFMQVTIDIDSLPSVVVFVLHSAPLG